MMYAHSIGRAYRCFPRRTALICGNNSSTFQESHDRVAHLAATLSAQGFARGDRLALLLPNGTEYIELIYACSWLGVIVVPVNVRLSVVEIDAVLVDAKPRGLIRHSSLPAPTTSVLWQRVLDQQPWEYDTAPPPEPLYDPQAILALIYTSGTTGRPKGAVITHDNILANVLHLNYWLPYKERDVHLHAAPMFHIMEFPLIFTTAAMGASQVTIPKFSPESLCVTVQRCGVTHTVLVPTMISLLMEFPDLTKYDLSSLKQLAYGGAPVHPALIRRMREVLPRVQLMQGYGLTESGVLTGLRDQEHTEQHLLSCGRSCPGVDLRVENASGAEVPTGQPGELVVRGATVMQGYLQNPKENELAFRNSMFRTGDIGYQDADGYFYILDRLKEMIVTGGENVYCGEVEAAILQHPAVMEAAVYGIPDPEWGEIVMASIVLKPGQTLSADELIAHCRQYLAHYKVPRRIEFSKSGLPRSGTGKILKRVLRERFWTHQQRAVN